MMASGPVDVNVRGSDGEMERYLTEIWTMADDGDFDEEVRGQVKRMKTKAVREKL